MGATSHRALRTAAAVLSVMLLLRPITSVRATEQAPDATSSPVLVELFTSEGCSSCPPADALLARLDHDQPVPGADIIVLGEHVDYWNSLGWKDRFSSGDLTQRQKDYADYFHLADVYTPQIVVNGSKQLNGSDGAGVGRAIKQAANKAVLLHLASLTVRNQTVTFTLMPGPPIPESVNVYAALVDPEATTEVRAGENSGRTLHHAGVVRYFAHVGSSLQMKELDRGPFTFKASTISPRPNRTGTPDAPLDGMRLVVFAQMKRTGPVLGIVSCTLDLSPHPQSPAAPNRCPPASI